MNIIAVIPARMAATRFPGKPLADIHGIAMIGHVYFRVKKSQLLTAAYIATCDTEIENYATQIQAPCIMTASTHERCTDRTAEAVLKIEAATKEKIDIVVMVQGDEPMTYPQMIDQAIAPMLADKNINIVNLMAKVNSVEEFNSANIVKVVLDQNNNALYFSREPIPSIKKTSANFPKYKQLGLIAFRRDYLLRFNQLPATPLEEIESVDMLRVLEHGDKINMVLTDYQTFCVDTPNDLGVVKQKMLTDELAKTYLS